MTVYWDIDSILKANISRYSYNQKKIAEFVSSNLYSVAFNTAKDIAESTGVSESSISRFVVLIGFKNFLEFQKNIQKHLMNKLGSDNRFIQALPVSKNNTSSLDKFITQEIENITNLQRIFDPIVFDQAVKAIIRAQKILIVGVRATASLAQRLYFGIYKLRLNVHKVDKISIELFEDIDRLCSKDLIISIAFPRYLSSMKHVMQNAKEKGVKVISITDSEFSLIRGDINLYCPVKTTTFLPNHCAPTILITNLVHEVSLCNQKRTIAVLKEHEILFERNKFFLKRPNLLS